MSKNQRVGVELSFTRAGANIPISAALPITKLDLKLPPELEAALAREARRARKPKMVLLRRALETYLEELADARAVTAARAEGGKPISWTEVKRRHGLAG